MWLLLAAAAGLAPATDLVQYKAVTETEYSIELTLSTQGRALFQFDSSEADGSSPPSHKELLGTWSRQGSLLKIHLTSGANVTYQQTRCLPYREFGQARCSPGLKLVSTNIPVQYGLQRFGLWDVRLLRVEP